ncbi:MAG TPA: LemA family protein [Clostridiales bacterium]|nr:LemA family protein [Clostridiales bacterium]
MSWIIISLVIPVILLLIIFAILMYNNLVKSKLKVENSWATIDTQLIRRFDLIPNLQELVKSYVKHEKDSLIEITKIKTQYVNADGIEGKIKAADDCETLFKSMFALVEAYPDLKANQNFLNLQNQLAEIENILLEF